jgi:hypothetical protein
MATNRTGYCYGFAAEPLAWNGGKRECVTRPVRAHGFPQRDATGQRKGLLYTERFPGSIARVMPAQSKKTFKSYMKPVAKRVTIQKPQQKQMLDPLNVRADGFTRISDSKIRKAYK